MKISHREEFLLSLSANALYDFYSLIKSTFVVIKGLLCLYSKQDNTWLLVDMKFRIMCTIGGLGRHIGRQSTDISVYISADYRSTVDRQSTDSRPKVDR